MIKYAVIILARNEEAGIVKTLESLVNQVHLPEQVIVVNDGSTDGTEEVLKGYADRHSRVRYLNFPCREEYKLGGRIIRMFKFAFQSLEASNISCEFVVKMDADIEFDSNFFPAFFRIPIYQKKPWFRERRIL